MYGYIYITTNKITGKRYIGKRKGEFSTKYIGSGKYLWNAIKKYGKENFYVEPIQFCESLDMLNKREKYWIKHYNAQQNPNFYNIAPGGDGGRIYEKHPLLGKQHSIKTKNKISFSIKKWHSNKTEEEKILHKEKIKTAHLNRDVYKKTETALKISIKLKGKSKTVEHNLKNSLSQKGKPKNPKSVEKMRKTLSDGRLKGKNNPMYNKGELISGGKNGRAKKVYVYNNDILIKVFDCRKDCIEELNIKPSLVINSLTKNIQLSEIVVSKNQFYESTIKDIKKYPNYKFSYINLDNTELTK